MAHFAKLGDGNIVTEVVVVSNDVATDENAGINFLHDLYGDHIVWKQTSYNSNIRKNFAGIGFTYNEELDAFVPPQPFQSWTLNTTTCQWEAPVSHPNDGNIYNWNEVTRSWVQV